MVSSGGSSFFPLKATRGALQESGHGFVCATNLDLEEERSVIFAHGLLGTLHFRAFHVFPGFAASEHIVHFLPFQVHFILELGLDSEYVGACFAEESKVSHGLLGEQDVGTGWAK